MIRKIWMHTSWMVLLLLFAVPFLLRNLLLPMMADDYGYAFIWNGEDCGNLMDGIGLRERIDSLGDILTSQWSHYFTWGGRTPSMIFIQLFAWKGKIWFDFANTIVFSLLMVVQYWLSVGKIISPSQDKVVFLWVMVGMLFGVIDYPSTMLWMTGACVYLWTGLWECLFLLPFVTRCHPSVVLMAVAGLLAGWSEEAGSLVTVFISGCYLGVAVREKSVERWMITGFVSLLIGCAILMLCPGSISREQLLLQYDAEYVMPADKLFTAEMFWSNFTEGFLPILIWESFLLIPFLWNRVKSFVPRLFLIGSMLVLCAMMFAPEFALRTGFHSTLFLTVASSAVLKESVPRMKLWLEGKGIRRMVAKTVAAVAVVYGLLMMVGCFWVEISLRQQTQERLAYVYQHRDEPLIVVKPLQIPYGIDRYLGPRSLTEFHLIYGADLEYKPSDNRSLMYAQYYGLKAIRTDREVDWKKYGEE